MAANRAIRASSAASRLLAAEVPADRLYRRLSDLGNGKGMVASSIDAYLREGRKVNKDELDRCIHEFRKYRRHTLALEIMEWMEFRKYNFRPLDYGVHLDLIAKAKGIPEAEKYLSELPAMARGSSAYGCLLNCYCAERMCDKAESLFSKMMEEKMIHNSKPCNSLMSLYLKLEMPEKVVALREEMKKMNIEPNTFTYNMLMRSYSILKDVVGVEGALEEMENRENGKLCNWTTYSSLAIAYINCGHKEKAKAALEKLEEQMDQPREPYHFLITLYAQLSDLDNVVRVWETLKSTLPVVNNTSYLIMLQALKNVGDIEGIKKWYEEWESCHGHSFFDMRIANAVIGAYLNHGMLQEAEAVLAKALDASTGYFFTNTWDMFVAFFLDKEDVERALRMMASCRDLDLEPEKLEQLLGRINREHDIGSVRELHEFVKGIAVSANTSVCKSLLRAYLSS